MTNPNQNPKEVAPIATMIILNYLSIFGPLTKEEISKRSGIHPHFINNRLQVLLMQDRIEFVSKKKQLFRLKQEAA